MNCSTFKKNLDDYVEDDDMSQDIKNAMKKHISECNSCKRLYEQEMSINRSFEEVFKSSGVLFNSSRISIINSIDKKRYKKSFFSKFYYHTKKYRIQYSACAAIIAFMVLFTPFMLSKFKVEDKELNVKDEIVVADNNDNDSNSSNSSNIVNDKKTTEVKEATEVKKENPEKANVKQKVEKSNYVPQITKKQESKDVKIQMNTDWRYSPNGQYSATVAGKGEKATEEGIAKVFIKDMNNENIWSFELANNTKQYTPKILEWWDDDNILITIGYGYGSTSPGGNLYLLKLNSNKISEVYKTEDEARYQITEVKKDNNNIKLKVNVFEDDNFTKSHIENWTLNSFNVNTLKNNGVVKNK